MAHGHDQHGIVARADAQLDPGPQGQKRHAAMAADHALGPAGGSGRVHERPGVGVGHLRLRCRRGGAQQQVLVVLPAGSLPAEQREARGRDVERVTDFLDGGVQAVLRKHGSGAAVVDDETHLRRAEPEVQGHGDQPGLRGCGIDSRPFQPVVGQHRHAVPLRKSQSQQRVGKPAGAVVPPRECKGPFQVPRPQRVGLQPGKAVQHLSEGQQRLRHVRIPAAVMNPEFAKIGASFKTRGRPGLSGNGWPVGRRPGPKAVHGMRDRRTRRAEMTVPCQRIPSCRRLAARSGGALAHPCRGGPASPGTCLPPPA